MMYTLQKKQRAARINTNAAVVNSWHVTSVLKTLLEPLRQESLLINNMHYYYSLLDQLWLLSHTPAASRWKVAVHLS